MTTGTLSNNEDFNRNDQERVIHCGKRVSTLNLVREFWHESQTIIALKNYAHDALLMISDEVLSTSELNNAPVHV